MKNNLEKILGENLASRFATDAGTVMHKKLEQIFFLPSGATGDQDLCDKLSKNPELMEFMGALSKTEVPIAGIINGHFVSRRIDRLYVSDDTKRIVVIDYKTDTDKNVFYDQYVAQLTEYRDLLKQAFPGYNISCKILWTCDFTLENVI